MVNFETCDVFTKTPFSGNPLAIVYGADDLSTEQMQTIAREFNLSETIFVQTPDNPAHSAKVRIFFPTAEIPFAGHPTIGCAIALASSQNEGDFNVLITLEERAGLVPVTVSRTGDAVSATFTAPVVPEPRPIAAPPEMVAPAIGLEPHQVGPGTVHTGGPTFLYVQVDSLDTLARAQPQEPAWSSLMAACDLDSMYLFVPTSQGFQARMFAPTAGIPEDPATGSASAIFASWLMQNGHLGEGTTECRLAQGVEMGRPSDIGFAADVEDGALTAVRITGSSVPISSGEITLP